MGGSNEEEIKLSPEFKEIYQKIQNQLGDINENDKEKIFNKLKKIEEKSEEIESEKIRKSHIAKLDGVLIGENNLENIYKFIDLILDVIEEEIKEQNEIIEEPEIKLEPEKELFFTEAQENLNEALEFNNSDVRKALKADPFKINKEENISTEDFDSIEDLFLEEYESKLEKLNNKTETDSIIKEKNILKTRINNIKIRRNEEKLEKLEKSLKEKKEKRSEDWGWTEEKMKEIDIDIDEMTKNAKQLQMEIKELKKEIEE